MARPVLSTLFIVMVAFATALSLPGHAQPAERDTLPLHFRLDNIKIDSAQPLPDSDALVSVEGVVGEIYKNALDARYLWVHGRMKLNVICRVFSSLDDPTVANDNPVPLCDALRKARSVELWANGGGAGGLPAVMYAVPK